MIGLQDVRKVAEVEPMPKWLALPLCLFGLVFIAIGAIAGLVWQLMYIGWACGWWAALRFEAYIEKNRKPKPAATDPPPGDPA